MSREFDEYFHREYLILTFAARNVLHFIPESEWEKMKKNGEKRKKKSAV